jgi:hypothetical protein
MLHPMLVNHHIWFDGLLGVDWSIFTKEGYGGSYEIQGEYSV